VSQDGKNVQLLTKELNGRMGSHFHRTKSTSTSTIGMRRKRSSCGRGEFDGTLSNGKVFFDMTFADGEDALDGMKIDQKGNLYVSGPGVCGSSPQRASIWARLLARASA